MAGRFRKSEFPDVKSENAYVLDAATLIMTASVVRGGPIPELKLGNLNTYLQHCEVSRILQLRQKQKPPKGKACILWFKFESATDGMRSALAIVRNVRDIRLGKTGVTIAVSNVRYGWKRYSPSLFRSSRVVSRLTHSSYQHSFVDHRFAFLSSEVDSKDGESLADFIERRTLHFNDGNFIGDPTLMPVMPPNVQTADDADQAPILRARRKKTLSSVPPIVSPLISKSTGKKKEMSDISSVREPLPPTPRHTEDTPVMVGSQSSALAPPLPQPQNTQHMTEFFDHLSGKSGKLSGLISPTSQAGRTTAASTAQSSSSSLDKVMDPLRILDGAVSGLHSGSSHMLLPSPSAMQRSFSDRSSQLESPITPRGPPSHTHFPVGDPSSGVGYPSTTTSSGTNTTSHLSTFMGKPPGFRSGMHGSGAQLTMPGAQASTFTAGLPRYSQFTPVPNQFISSAGVRKTHDYSADYMGHGARMVGSGIPAVSYSYYDHHPSAAADQVISSSSLPIRHQSGRAMQAGLSHSRIAQQTSSTIRSSTSASLSESVHHPPSPTRKKHALGVWSETSGDPRSHEVLIHGWYEPVTDEELNELCYSFNSRGTCTHRELCFWRHWDAILMCDKKTQWRPKGYILDKSDGPPAHVDGSGRTLPANQTDLVYKRNPELARKRRAEEKLKKAIPRKPTRVSDLFESDDWSTVVESSVVDMKRSRIDHIYSSGVSLSVDESDLKKGQRSSKESSPEKLNKNGSSNSSGGSSSLSGKNQSKDDATSKIHLKGSSLKSGKTVDTSEADKARQKEFVAKIKETLKDLNAKRASVGTDEEKKMEMSDASLIEEDLKLSLCPRRQKFDHLMKAIQDILSDTDGDSTDTSDEFRYPDGLMDLLKSVAALQ